MDIKPTILIDTREQVFDHLANFYDKNDINYARKKLDVGDYSFGIIEDGQKKSFEDEIVVERKGSGRTGLGELAVNITKYRDRFERELSADVQIHLMIEDGSWKDIIKGNYRSNMSSKSYIASLLTFLQRYNIHIHMVEKSEVGQWMYNLFYYYLYEKRKGN